MADIEEICSPDGDIDLAKLRTLWCATYELDQDKERLRRWSNIMHSVLRAGLTNLFKASVISVKFKIATADEKDLLRAELGVVNEAARLAFTVARRLVMRTPAEAGCSEVADDYVTALIEMANAEGVSPKNKNRLIAEARMVCSPRYFSSMADLIKTSLHLAATSRNHEDYVRIRRDILRIQDSVEAQAACWELLYPVTGDPLDRQRASTVKLAKPKRHKKSEEPVAVTV